MFVSNAIIRKRNESAKGFSDRCTKLEQNVRTCFHGAVSYSRRCFRTFVCNRYCRVFPKERYLCRTFELNSHFVPETIRKICNTMKTQNTFSTADTDSTAVKAVVLFASSWSSIKLSSRLFALLAGIAVMAMIPNLLAAGNHSSSLSPETAVPVSETSGTIKGHEWVDLGLSVKWATCNVGASSPSEYGNYYAWGEAYTKNDYNWSSYRYCTGDGDYFSKYVPSDKPDFWYGSDEPDDRTRLVLSDDVAQTNWGGTWRIPTDSEWTELRTECTWTWAIMGGRKGYIVIGKNGNSIFLPAAGFRNYLNLDGIGDSGYYWTSSLNEDDPEDAWRVRFSLDFVSRYSTFRYYGFSVRPVSD